MAYSLFSCYYYYYASSLVAGVSRIAGPSYLRGMFWVAHSSGALAGDNGLTGLVLIDSIVFMRDMVNRNAGIVNVARRLVDEIFVITGIGVTAVYRGGVTFGAHKVGSTYTDMFKWCVSNLPMASYEFLLVVSMGNDSYFSALSEMKGDSSMKARTLAGIKDFLEFTREYAETRKLTMMLVYGASSAVWRYTGPIGSSYDRHVKLAVQFVEELAYDDLVICTGSNELSSIVWSDVVDRIGHLDVRAYHKLVAAMICWVFRVSLCCDDLLFRGVSSKL